MSGYIDFHIHALGIREYIKSNPKLRECIKKIFYLNTSPQPIKVLFKQMEQANVEKGVLISLDATRVFNCNLPGNDIVYELVRNYPSKFIGIGSVDPLKPDVMSELEKIYSKYEFKGVFLSPAYQGFNPLSENVSKIYEYLQDHNMMLIIQLGMIWYHKVSLKWNNPLIIDDVARSYRNLKIIITHMAWPWIEDLYTVMFRNRNVYAIVSGVFTGTPEEHLRTILIEGYRRRITERFICHRLLFGSEFPRMEIWKMSKAIENSNLSEYAKRRILRDNALELLSN